MCIWCVPNGTSDLLEHAPSPWQFFCNSNISFVAWGKRTFIPSIKELKSGSIESLPTFPYTASQLDLNMLCDFWSPSLPPWTPPSYKKRWLGQMTLMDLPAPQFLNSMRIWEEKNLMFLFCRKKLPSFEVGHLGSLAI